MDFEISIKKGCFLSFEWEKSNFTTFGSPMEKFRKNPLVPPLEKILPTLMLSGTRPNHRCTPICVAALFYFRRRWCRNLATVDGILH